MSDATITRQVASCSASRATSTIFVVRAGLGAGLELLAQRVRRPLQPIGIGAQAEQLDLSRVLCLEATVQGVQGGQQGS